jgi:hypothetical protein
MAISKSGGLDEVKVSETEKTGLFGTAQRPLKLAVPFGITDWR